MLYTENFSISYRNGGLFSTTLPWSHPPITEETYEIIYVTQGKVHMVEQNEEFTLQIGYDPNYISKLIKNNYLFISLYYLLLNIAVKS